MCGCRRLRLQWGFASRRRAGPNQVAVEAIPYPKLEWPGTGKKIEHAVVLKVIVSNICGSDQHSA